MIICSPISSSARNVVYLTSRVHHAGSTILNMVSSGQSTSFCFCLYPARSSRNYTRFSISKAITGPSIVSFQLLSRNRIGSSSSKQNGSLHSVVVKGLFYASCSFKRHVSISLGHQNLNMRLSLLGRGVLSRIRGNVGFMFLRQECASTALIFGLLVCYSIFEPTHAEAAAMKKNEEGADPLYVKSLHGKKVYTDYSITGIPGDGRCLFRSVAHGACLRSGKTAPNESVQGELADDLRARVADEFVKRRKETEWFVEGDFDTYVAHIRKPHVWGGEPELFMASHVLRMPITVYMYDKEAGGLISIAEYGEEYGKDNPIRVLYHGFGHYDALQIPSRKDAESKL